MKRSVRTAQAARFFVVTALILTIYLLFQVLRPFLPGIAWAIFFATAFYPLHARLLRWVNGRRMPASIMTTVLVAALICVPAATLVLSLADTVPEIVSAAKENSHRFPVASESSAETSSSTQPTHLFSEELSKYPIVAEIEAWLGKYTNLSRLNLQQMFASAINRLAQGLTTQARNLLQNALRTLLTFVVMIFTMVFLLSEGDRILDFCRRSLPLREEDKDAVFTRLQTMTRAVFYGVMMTALVQAILGSMGWLIAGLPKPVIFGIAMFFSALIPIGGTALVWGPGVVYLFMQGETARAIILLVWGTLVVAGIDNFLKPIFISNRTRLHMLLVFFGIFGGLAAFGLVGLFMGPLILTLFFFLLEVVRRDLFPGEKIQLSNMDHP